MSIHVQREEQIKGNGLGSMPRSLILLVVAVAIALFLGGGVLGLLDLSIDLAIVVAIVMVAAIFLRHDALAVTLLIAIQLYVDWYLGLHIVAALIAPVMLGVFFLGRSPRHPWVEPPAMWLWVLFLLLTILPAIRGALTPYDTASYYPNDIFGALILFWLGLIVGHDTASVRRFCKIFAAFGTLVAIHTIIQTTTGIVLFASPRATTLLAAASDYQLLGSNASRAGSFFIDPNWNGTFLAMIFFLPFGLLFERPSLLEKGLYFAEMCLILPALLFTYSNGAWAGTLAGLIAFMIFVGRYRYRVFLIILMSIFAGAMFVFFPQQIALQIQHTTGITELPLRIGGWQTAVDVIRAFPWSGVGLGYTAYQSRSEPYRVPAQFVSLAHPHNSYLEWGAMAGLPVLLIFVTLLGLGLWMAVRNWRMVDVHTRALFGGGIAAIVTLSVNSWSINGWTLAALAMIGWLVLGVISSPLLAKSQQQQQDHTIIENSEDRGSVYAGLEAKDTIVHKAVV